MVCGKRQSICAWMNCLAWSESCQISCQCKWYYKRDNRSCVDKRSGHTTPRPPHLGSSWTHHKYVSDGRIFWFLCIGVALYSNTYHIVLRLRHVCILENHHKHDERECSRILDTFTYSCSSCQNSLPNGHHFYTIEDFCPGHNPTSRDAGMESILVNLARMGFYHSRHNHSASDCSAIPNIVVHPLPCRPDNRALSHQHSWEKYNDRKYIKKKKQTNERVT